MPEKVDMHRQSHLVQQPSTRTYFFRSIIPKALRNHFDGQREFKVSLGCKSKARSQRASFHLYGVVHHLYDSIQAGQSQMTLEEIKNVLRIELEKSFRYIKHIQLRTNRYNAERVQAAIADLEAKKSSRLDYYANKSEQTESRIEEKLSKYEQRFGQQWEMEGVIMEITASQVQQSWGNLASMVFVPHREEDYQRLVEVLDRLIDLVGEDESHPLASMMEVVGVLVAKYEEEYVPELEEDNVA